LIRRAGGDPFVAPSVKEAPFRQHEEAYGWAERLLAGEFDLLTLMTGVGLGYLRDVVVKRYPLEVFSDALRRVTLISRGPKPAAVLHEMGVVPQITAPEPNTWREIVPLIAERSERRISIQEYGRPNPEFIAALEALGAQVTSIAIYRWTLPDNLGPLREAVRRIAGGECDVVLFTTSIQLTHLLDVAEQMGRAGEVRRALAEDMAVGSVGPVMNAALADSGLAPDIVPAHPKMAALVWTAAEMAVPILARKRSAQKGGQACGLAVTLSKR